MFILFPSSHTKLTNSKHAVDHIQKQKENVQSNRYKGGNIIMSSKNTTSVPEAKEAMNRFKYEVANELGVPLKDGYNGDLTSKQNGSVGGYMVKKMIEAQEKQMAGK